MGKELIPVPRSIFINICSGDLKSENLMNVTERNFNFGIEDCFSLNFTLKHCRISQGKKRTLRVKNCLYFDVELFLELVTKLFSEIYF